MGSVGRCLAACPSCLRTMLQPAPSWLTLRPAPSWLALLLAPCAPRPGSAGAHALIWAQQRVLLASSCRVRAPVFCESFFCVVVLRLWQASALARDYRG